MTHRNAVVFALTALAVLLVASRSHAGLLSDPNAVGFSPRVPLSAFARPAAWFDPARLHLTSTMSVGSGFGGQTSALSLTSLSYQFRAPVTLSVNIGNSFGLDRARKGSSFFLEGLDLTWRPNRNSIFRVEMHDVRSPLQYGSGFRGFGPVDPFTASY
jgi:hypothetical protein